MTAPPEAKADRYTRPYWDGLREGRVMLPRCCRCGHLQFPMGPCCSECLHEEFRWERMSGRGQVWSYVVYHHAFHPAFADRLPYNVATVLLDEGPRLLSNVVGVPADAIRSGLRVVAELPAADGLLRFRPDAAA